MSSISTISYISSDIVFIGSHFSDSQLVRILSTGVPASFSLLQIPSDVKTTAPSNLADAEGKGKGKEPMISNRPSGAVLETGCIYLEVVESWPNIAPILDAAVADTDGSGQVSYTGFSVFLSRL